MPHPALFGTVDEEQPAKRPERLTTQRWAFSCSTTRTTTDTLVTRSTYRRLLMRGLSPEEAANLTAFMCGIPVDQVRWSLRQINQLLFLRERARSGRFGARDGGSAPPALTSTSPTATVDPSSPPDRSKPRRSGAEPSSRRRFDACPARYHPSACDQSSRS